MTIDRQGRKSSEPSTLFVSQQPHYWLPVTVRELDEQPHRFNIDPPFQRKKAWNRKQCQQLIETIFQGRPIGTLEGYKEEDAMEGGTIYGVIDGHQRITAIQLFLGGHFKTWTNAQKMQAFPNSKPPIQPGKFFRQLDANAKNYLLDYRIYINIIEKMPEKELVERFLEIQCHTPLSPAERLYAYPSKAKDIAKCISTHPFWDDFYGGEKNRGQLFQSSLYLLALEMAPTGIVDLRGAGGGGYVADLASGKYDKSISGEVENAIWENLDTISCVYNGAHFTDRVASVVMYQSMRFVRQSGYVIRSSTDKGRLATWVNNLLVASKDARGIAVYHQPVQKLLYASGQRAFWDKQLEVVLSLFGITMDGDILLAAV